MNKIVLFITLSVCLSISHAKMIQPQLIVQIVVDQLRGDLIYHYQKQFGDKGFNYLINHGLDYHNTHHPHANTTTCAGHATIATGSYPSLHGIINNDWFDRKTKRTIYCVEDLNNPILQVSPIALPLDGRSPRTLKASTISDEMVLAKKGRAFSVSFKDRAAIMLGGHSGKAFWFDKKNGGFISSSFYYSIYPQWVQTWNKNYHPVAFDWNLSREKSTYINANTVVFPHKDKLFNETFPHHVVNPPSEEYFRALYKTPKADELTADFATTLIINEKLGQNPNQTDYLGISFSATDPIGHEFSPNSLEGEDNLIRLDRTLAGVLAAIDKQVGLKNTLIIVSADHGVSDSPLHLKDNHIPEIKPLDIGATAAFIKTNLMTQFSLPPETLMSVAPPYVYLDTQIIANHKLQLSQVSQYLAGILNQQQRIFRAYALPSKTMGSWLSQKVDRMAYPYRAGDIYLVQPPYQSHGANKEDRVAHGSPWQYDSFVPLLFSHPSFKAQKIFRPVYTTDIAPTLASLLLIKPPSAAVGKPLVELLNAARGDA